MWYVAKHGAAQSPGLSGSLGLNWLLCKVQKMKIARESALGCDTWGYWKGNKLLHFSSGCGKPLIGTAMWWRIGIVPLVLSCKQVCLRNKDVKKFISNKWIKKVACCVGLIGSGTFIPGVPVKRGTFGLVHWKPLCLKSGFHLFLMLTKWLLSTMSTSCSTTTTPCCTMTTSSYYLGSVRCTSSLVLLSSRGLGCRVVQNFQVLCCLNCFLQNQSYCYHIPNYLHLRRC